MKANVNITWLNRYKVIEKSWKLRTNGRMGAKLRPKFEWGLRNPMKNVKQRECHKKWSSEYIYLLKTKTWPEKKRRNNVTEWAIFPIHKMLIFIIITGHSNAIE